VARGKIPGEKRVLDYLRSSRKGPQNAKDIAKGLSVAPRDFRSFRQSLQESVERGRICLIKGRRYALPDKINRVVGRIGLTRKGDAFVAPDKGGQEIFVPARAIDSAMDGDKVVVRLEGQPQGRSPLGRVIKVLERAHDTIVGVYHASRSFGVVRPQDRRLGREVVISQGMEGAASDGDVVVVRVVTFGSGKMNPIGRVETVLGRSDDPGVDILAVIHGHDLPVAFSGEILDAARQRVSQARGVPGRHRVDRRDVHVFTIDPADAKDHDDALSIRALESDRWEVGIHIADVSHFVSAGDAVDLEALKRGTSVYLVDRVLPMLPEVLSSDACSLLPGVDRFAVSIFAVVNSAGDVGDTRFERTEIRSRHKLSYEKAQEVLEGTSSLDQPTELALRDLRTVSRALRKSRERRGALDFDLPEARVVLGEGGRPVDIQPVERLESHRLVEDFMLLANEIAAAEATQHGIPVLYRVHEPPPADRISYLRRFLSRLGHSMPKGDIGPKALQRALEWSRGRAEEALVSTLVLRSMSRARYDVRNLGHFGLASRGYTHFTSPIRRYPDLLLHQVLTRSLIDGEAIPRSWGGEDLKATAEHCSVRERTAEHAERESVDLKKAEYMQRHLGDDFVGTVSGITAFGLFVMLDEVFVDGLIHVSSMTEDYYTFDVDRYTLVGERSRRVFRLGDRLTVRISRVDKEERLIDFTLVDKKRDRR
jgi:ribonuclease R